GASAAYIHNAVYGEPSAIDFVAWSLEIEVQFYLLAPLLALLFTIRRLMWRWLLMLSICVGTASMQLIPGANMWLWGNIPGYLPYFIAGFLLVDLYLMAKIRRSDWRWDLQCRSSAGVLYLL